MSFQLTKWYGDSVTAAGECRIGYWAELEWRGVHVRYASLIEAGPGRAVKMATTLRAGAGPAADGDGYRWAEPALGLEWRWAPAAPAWRERLLETDEGYVDWACVAPAATVNGGEGYLERLELTIVPWRLPMETLRWGRYAGGGDSLVWIDWLGAHRRRLVLRKGVPVEAAEIGDGFVRLAGGEELECDCGLTVREGALGPNVLAGIPGLEGVVPLRLLRLEEHKWLSRAAVRLRGQAESEGWAIHEVVRWP